MAERESSVPGTRKSPRGNRGRTDDLVLIVETLAEEVGRLRKNLAKQQKVQAEQHQKLEQSLGDVHRRLGGDEVERRPRSEITQSVSEGQLGPNQLRALLTFDQSLLELMALTDTATNEEARTSTATVADSPISMREGLDMLQIRLRNLQRSMGLEPVPSIGHPFDAEIHQVERTEQRPDVPDGQVLEEVIPGYRYQGEVVRPARVVVNERS